MLKNNLIHVDLFYETALQFFLFKKWIDPMVGLNQYP